jgi:hypothetical protein
MSERKGRKEGKIREGGRKRGRKLGCKASGREKGRTGQNRPPSLHPLSSSGV